MDLTTVQVYNIHHFLQGPETVHCYTNRLATSYVGPVVQLAAVSRQERPFTRAFACIPPFFQDVWYTHPTMAITISLVEDTKTRATFS